MANKVSAMALISVAIILTGCLATQKTATLTSTVDAFDKAVQSARESLEGERKTKPRTRRYEAIEYYILSRNIKGDAAVTPDLTPSDPVGSFSRYACAGDGSLIREGNALSYASAYSAGLKDILEPGKATLMGQFSRFAALNKPIAAPRNAAKDDPRTEKVSRVQTCADGVQKILTAWRPKPTTDPYDENPALLLPVAITAYQAIEAFLTTSLTTWNNYEAKVKFAKYVDQWDKDFKKVMEEDLSEDRLAASWDHRIAVSLHRPGSLFTQIFRTPENYTPDKDIERIRDIGIKVNNELAEFDALRLAPKPQDIRKALLSAQQRLVQFSKDPNASPEHIISFLSGLIDEFNDAKKKYADADKATRDLIKAFNTSMQAK